MDMCQTIAKPASEPFFATKNGRGNGLGRSTVQGLAKQSGAEVPRQSLPGNATEDHTVREGLPGIGRVLLVDDNAAVLAMTKTFLKWAGLEVVTADNGDQALALLAAAPPFDVLVTDYEMPGMNGAILIMRARATQPDLPVLIVTGLVEPTLAAALDNDVEVLRKPFGRRQLIEAVLSAMDRGSNAGTGAQAGLSAKPWRL